MTETTRHLAIYFIDENNFDKLHDSFLSGDDALASQVYAALMSYLHKGKMSSSCSLCRQRMRNVTFVVFIKTDGPDRESLTSCICEDCVVRGDLDDRIEEAVRQWIPGVTCIVRDKRQTLH
jgi:hypothetical protein